jgi:hypothetical protein
MKCPTCRKPAPYQGNAYRPFCSERCKLIDLGKWADGTFRVPGESVSLDQAEEPGAGLDPDTADDDPDVTR